MFSWSLSKGLLCLLFMSSFSILISYSHCNKSLQTCWKQQEFIPQFCRLEVQHESRWATVKVLAGLCFFFWGKIHFLAISSCYSSLMTPFFHLQSQQHRISGHSSVQFSHSIVSDSFWPPMECSMPGLPVHQQLLEFTQTHVHQGGDAIQPSHPLSSPSPPALNLSQHQGLFKWVSSLHQVAKVLEFQLQN